MLLTVPFAVSGSAAPMLWQAVNDMHFRLAGAALKTPNAQGGPWRRASMGCSGILSVRTLGVRLKPPGTPAQLATVRPALRTCRSTGSSSTGPVADPVYASGFLTVVLAMAPTSSGSWGSKVLHPAHMAPMITGASLGPAACCPRAPPPGTVRWPWRGTCWQFAGQTGS